MSILGSLIDSIGVNSPRKAPSTRDRLANDLVAAEGLQVKREKANDYIKQIEATFANDLKAKLREDPTFDTSGINLNKPTLSNYQAVYGEKKGLEIAINNTTIAQALLGDDIPGVSKKFNFNDLKKIQDPETGEEVFDLKVNVTNQKEGINYDTGLSFEGNSDNEQIAQDAESRGEDGVAAVESQTFRPTQSEMESIYMATRNALVGSIGGESTIEDLKGPTELTFTSEYRQNLQELFPEQDDASGPEENAGATTSDTTISKTADATTSENQTALTTLKNIKTATIYTDDQIKAFPGIKFDQYKLGQEQIANREDKILQALIDDPDADVSEMIATQSRARAFQQKTIDRSINRVKNEIEQEKTLMAKKSTGIKTQISDAKTKLRRYNNSPEEKARLETLVTNLEAQQTEITNKIGTVANPGTVTKINKAIDKTFKPSNTLSTALDTALKNGNIVKILELSEEILKDKTIPTELEQEIVSLFQETNNHVRINKITEQANNNIVLGILASMPKEERVSIMPTLISFAQTGKLDAQLELNEINAITSRDTLNFNKWKQQNPTGLSANGNKIRDYDIYDENQKLKPTAGADLTRYQLGNTTAADDAMWAASVGQYLKAWTIENEKVDFWTRVTNLGFWVTGQDQAAFTLGPNVRWNKAEDRFIILGPDGKTMTESYLSAAEVKSGLGIEGFVLMKQAAKRFAKQ
jgi:hypothetical protein